MASCLCHGFSLGFHLSACITSLKSTSGNFPCASFNPQIIDKYLHLEISKGRVSGPFLQQLLWEGGLESALMTKCDLHLIHGLAPLTQKALTHQLNAATGSSLPRTIISLPHWLFPVNEKTFTCFCSFLQIPSTIHS